MDVQKLTILILLFIIVTLYSYDYYQQCFVDLEQEYYIFMNYSDKHCHLELGKKYHFGSDKIKINYQKAIEMYLHAIQHKDYVAYIYLAQLYLDIKDTESSIYYYNKAIEKGYFQCFINLGDIYFYEKDYIDLDLAEQNYKAAIKHSTFTDAKVEANEKLKILQAERSDDYYNSEDTDNEIDIDTLMKYDIADIEETPVPGFNIIMDKIKDKHYIQQELKKNDTQNVHDHVVSNTVKKSIENLVNKTEILFDKAQSLIDIRKFLKTKQNNELVQDILDHIEISTVTYRDTNILESDLLHLVWNRIHNKCNEERLDMLKDNLYSRLLECNEEDDKVCASGIFSRLIDTLNYCDAENIVEIKPKYALNKELMTKAAKISKDFKEIQKDDLKEILDKSKLNEEEEKKVKNYIERLKIKLIEEFRKEYIDTKIISEDILFLEINKWIDYI